MNNLLEQADTLEKSLWKYFDTATYTFPWYTYLSICIDNAVIPIWLSEVYKGTIEFIIDGDKSGKVYREPASALDINSLVAILQIIKKEYGRL